MEKTYVIIPCLNEEKNIGRAVNNLKKEGYSNVIVVDDGSDDKTYDTAKSNGAIALRHIINRGQGAALQTGMTYALKQGAEYIVHFDGDNQHDSREIKNLLAPLIAGEAEAALGSRFMRKQEIPLLRKIMLKGSIIVVWVFYGIKLTDAHNGFRALTRSAAKKTILTTDRMEHASEIVERIKKSKIKYKEIPVTIKYSKETLQKGQSNLDSLKILFKMIMKKLGE
jgi:polyprenyl-phospho-N-acetylgalactosaminyl synthase